MSDFFHRHQSTLSAALAATQQREYFSAYPEVPSGKLYGETAKSDGEAAFTALLERPFDLPHHPNHHNAGAEASPFGRALGISYPTDTPDALIAAAREAAPALALASIETRVGVCLEALDRLNRISFLMGNATMHTTGQAFAMAFQAGGPHAQDRGLEAVAIAYAEMTRFAAQARWEKPQGKAAPIVLQKTWRLRPEGIALTIGCNTFPTWNSYPGLFASLATGNPVIVKPHPKAILPLALTVRVLREVLIEAGLSPNAVLLAVDEPGAEITKALATRAEIKLIDYTGAASFGQWLRDNARQAQLFTEETGVNSVIIAATDDLGAMCANLAFALSLYSGQMCTSPQNIYIPAGGITTDQGHKSFDEVAMALVAAVDMLLADPARADGICGAIANLATQERVTLAAGQVNGRVLRPGVSEGAQGPLILATQTTEPLANEESFGPIAFVMATRDIDEAVSHAVQLAKTKGAITAALYDTNDERISHIEALFLGAGVNLSINLMGNIFVNQSAAFSDFHVSGANPSGNASLTDTAFVASRFRRVMSRRLA